MLPVEGAVVLVGGAEKTAEGGLLVVEGAVALVKGGVALIKGAEPSVDDIRAGVRGRNIPVPTISSPDKRTATHCLLAEYFKDQPALCIQAGLKDFTHLSNRVFTQQKYFIPTAYKAFPDYRSMITCLTTDDGEAYL